MRMRCEEIATSVRAWCTARKPPSCNAATLAKWTMDSGQLTMKTQFHCQLFIIHSLLFRVSDAPDLIATPPHPHGWGYYLTALRASQSAGNLFGSHRALNDTATFNPSRCDAVGCMTFIDWHTRRGWATAWPRFAHTFLESVPFLYFSTAGLEFTVRFSEYRDVPCAFRRFVWTLAFDFPDIGTTFVVFALQVVRIAPFFPISVGEFEISLRRIGFSLPCLAKSLHAPVIFLAGGPTSLAGGR